MKAELFPAVSIPRPLLATKSGPGSDQFGQRKVVPSNQFSRDRYNNCHGMHSFQWIVDLDKDELQLWIWINMGPIR